MRVKAGQCTLTEHASYVDRIKGSSASNWPGGKVNEGPSRVGLGVAGGEEAAVVTEASGGSRAFTQALGISHDEPHFRTGEETAMNAALQFWHDGCSCGAMQKVSSPDQRDGSRFTVPLARTAKARSRGIFFHPSVCGCGRGKDVH